MLKENQTRLQFTLHEPVSTFQWTTFLALQFLDMYTTYNGLKYDCVEETNPLFGERPSVSKMGIRKFIILYPVVSLEMREQVMSQQDMRDVNTLMAIVVLNNKAVTNQASKRCYKLQKTP